MYTYLDYFKEFSKIPHGSGNTKKISDYLVTFAKSHNLKYRQDELNNIIIFKSASEGYENHEPVILQGHMDMVAVKENDCSKDMVNEGLDIIEDGNLLYANGTSLGGDDGVAVAYMLDILSGEYKHPKLECIITVDEETGMFGAEGLEVNDISAKRMVNIDNETEGSFIVGCAGGRVIEVRIPVSYEEKEGYIYRIKNSGLKGGHSGEEIDKKRCNAIKISGIELCKLMKKLNSEGTLNIADISGGTANNVIPSTSNIDIMLTTTGAADYLSEKEINEYIKESGENDKLTLHIEETVSSKAKVLDDDSTKKLIEVINRFPNGVISMDEVDSNFVQTSLNIGVIELLDDEVRIEVLIRSSSESKSDELLTKISDLCAELEVKYCILGSYPGWEYAACSPLRDTMVELYEKMYSGKPDIRPIHAGLECGIFQSKIKNLDCVSIGPELKDIHTTKEILYLDSAKRVFEYLIELLEIL